MSPLPIFIICTNVSYLATQGNPMSRTMQWFWFQTYTSQVINGLPIYYTGDQINMAVLFWYLSGVRYFTIANTGVTVDKLPEQHSHVYLVIL